MKLISIAALMAALASPALAVDPVIDTNGDSIDDLTQVDTNAEETYNDGACLDAPAAFTDYCRIFTTIGYEGGTDVNLSGHTITKFSYSGDHRAIVVAVMHGNGIAEHGYWLDGAHVGGIASPVPTPWQGSLCIIGSTSKNCASYAPVDLQTLDGVDAGDAIELN